jgi:hypothetical protein
MNRTSTRANDMAALEGRVVTEGHSRICRERGHATHTVAGVDTGTCPRCGETTIPAKPSPEIVDTSKLRSGDLVQTHGMNVRLGELTQYTDNGREVYHFTGQVENLDDVLADGRIPRSFLSEPRWVDGKGWEYDVTGRWDIQGNDLATWHRIERAAD